MKESHENVKSIIFQSHVSKSDQKNILNLFYCYTGLDAGYSTKEAIGSFFRSVRLSIYVYFAVVI